MDKMTETSVIVGGGEACYKNKILNFFSLKNLFFRKSNKKLSSFTLAEVLITLAIIGIIATLAILTLAKKYQAIILKSQFKKAHSVLTNAFTAVIADNPDFYNIMTKAGEKDNIQDEAAYYILKPALMSHLKISKDGGRADFIPVICDGTYKGMHGRNEGCYGFWGRDGQFETQDGMTFFTVCKQRCKIIYIFVDTNGYKKAPNVSGFDFFLFEITENNQLVPTFNYESGCFNIEKRFRSGLSCTKDAIIDPDYFKKLFK